MKNEKSEIQNVCGGFGNDGLRIVKFIERLESKAKVATIVCVLATIAALIYTFA